MAFKNAQPLVSQRERFDIYDQNDKKEIIYFENELRPYLERTATICGKVLKGLELYLHENGIFVYSTKYPEGAVRLDKLEEYRIASMKYQALTNLWDKRRQAEEKEKERIQALIPEGATA
jgi:hypothetical protein